jgi:hypothetical protein
MAQLLVRTSRKQSGQHVVVGAAIIVGLVWLVGLASPGVAIELLLFAVVVPFLVWQWLDRRPRLVLDERGLSGVRMGRLLVPWSQVRGVELRWLAGLDHISLEFGVAGQPIIEQRAILASDLDVHAPELIRVIREQANLDCAIKSPGP